MWHAGISKKVGGLLAPVSRRQQQQQQPTGQLYVNAKFKDVKVGQQYLAMTLGEQLPILHTRLGCYYKETQINCFRNDTMMGLVSQDEEWVQIPVD